MRLEANPDAFAISYNDSLIQIDDFNTKTCITVYPNSRNKVKMTVQDHEGEGSLGGFFWQDKEAKKCVKKLINFRDTKAHALAMAAIYKSMPEAVNLEFDKEVLDSKYKS
jgi:hypothetical protein